MRNEDESNFKSYSRACDVKTGSPVDGRAPDVHRISCVKENAVTTTDNRGRESGKGKVAELKVMG